MYESTALIERYFQAFSSGDIEGALACIHQDAIWHVDGDPEVVTTGIIRGREAVRAWLLGFPDGFRPITFSIEQQFSDQAEILVLGRFRHRVLPSESIVDSDYAIRFTLRDGLIGRYQIFEDSLLISQARANSSPGRMMRINGVLYGWDDVGQGKPVVFLHGLFLDRSFWAPHLHTLAAQRRCVAFDMPGHGVSTWREGMDLDAIAEDIALWLIENDAAPATLVGHSQGGMIAIRLAASYPELVERLILVNTSARAELINRLPEWEKRRDALLDGPERRREVFGEVQRFTTTAQWREQHSLDAEKELELMMRHDPTLLSHALSAAIFKRGDVRELLPRIGCPVTVISGAQDLATPPYLAEEIARLVQHGEVVVIDDAAHHVPIEVPKNFIEAVLNEV
ncbi:alpha/beta fold hydrolase [Halopseudomonas pelagia]|uniref:alpha/beta fold hydrolase n=1 Tax=Halopseudomonas pelagia TaxID=553151 RepID=UPI0003A9A8EE|nr:alpha/beta fold hydrolase [Halopseudomonas pelagia]|tara:strand:+ start:9710 stop:10900 length:1191 start_codon:yes stop_codon:yes gene_type:complete